jgi:hypothetical protein
MSTGDAEREGPAERESLSLIMWRSTAKCSVALVSSSILLRRLAGISWSLLEDLTIFETLTTVYILKPCSQITIRLLEQTHLPSEKSVLL